MRLALALAMVLVAAAPLVLITIGAGVGNGIAPGFGHVDGPNGHEASEGLVLAAAEPPQPSGGARCPGSAPIRGYDVVAIAVDITLNRYLDHDPGARMYVLEQDLKRVRAEEARNRRAREGQGQPAVTAGLQGDAIQPLALRVRPGECLRIRLRDDLRDPVSLHLHGAALRLAGTKAPALATSRASFAQPGETVDYEWMVPDSEPEGTHYFHSHGDSRAQTSHGLFGAVIVEPKGSTWLDPLTGRALRTGWAAVVRTPNRRSFREFALYYHEIGAENEQLRDRRDRLIPLVDTLLGDYRPGSRAINYRSEPFLNRMELQRRRLGRYDESVAYSSYSFGDPATPIMRTYLGDPVKQRVIHGGSDVFHVHHVHGGSIRWRRQPNAEPRGLAFGRGLDKHPPLLPQASERTDSQSIGPSETFDVEAECGAGGCQQSAGDFLFHCHIAHHYFAGMWGIWRVYNTLQDGRRSTDALPPLPELPDRAGRVEPAVTSEHLAGARVSWFGKRVTIARGHLAAFVEQQLPPRGRPRGYDASVLDWARSGNRYLGEPESRDAWPGYRSPQPGRRPELLFDPRSGKLAYPFLRPHLGKRPPFAPNHGPAPFLDPTPNGRDPPRPGANGPGSVCPSGTRLKSLPINAITLPIPINGRAHVVDPGGEIYVLRSEEDAVRRYPSLRRPLAIRANAAQDCVDVLFRSELEDSPDNHGFAKGDVHIHFVQFDIQASDGVDTGFNYEQGVRPFRLAGERLSAPAAAGADRVELPSAARFTAGAVVGVGMDRDKTLEIRRITAVDGRSLTFDRPLRHDHGAGEYVSAEFVRYRWYPDVQFGTAYFHDHVNAISSWRHGLFGALIAEPPRSTYRDPHTGAQVRSGPIADIHTRRRVTHDIAGSFRELVLFIQDDNPLTSFGLSTGSAYNLRAEPLDTRGGDPARYFSSRVHGDPETPVLDAYLGDPLMLRTLVAGTNDVHTFHVDGHWFRIEPYSATSPPVSTAHLGISERYDLGIPAAGGPQRMPGDYLFYSGRSFKLREGSWGIIRVRDRSQTSGLRKLPGREEVPAPAASVCPAGSPRKRFRVAAVEKPLPMLGVGSIGKMYVLEGVPSASGVPHAPLVLHVNVGDCIEVRLRNATTSGPVSFHADMLAFDPKDSGGVEVGRNPPQVVSPGHARTYTFYAHPQVGETVALVRDFGDVLLNPARGLYGAVVVGPKGASYTDPVTARDVSNGAAWRVDVHPPGAAAYRDFTLFLQDEDPSFGTHRMPYNRSVDGVVGLNYRAAALPDVASDTAQAFAGRPPTPLLDAFVGDPVRVHVLSPASEQAQVFTLEEHQWPQEPGRRGTNMLSSVQVGGLEAVTLRLRAGGEAGLPGSYVYGNHREPYREAGQWGIFRVRCGGDGLVRLQRSSGACGGGLSDGAIVAGGGAALLLGLLGAYAWRRRNGGGWLPGRRPSTSRG